MHRAHVAETGPLAGTMPRPALSGDTGESPQDDLPIGVRFAIAAGLRPGRRAGNAATPCQRAAAEHALVGGLARMLARTRPATPRRRTRAPLSACAQG